MLRKVLLKNFKLHASTELELRPITVFIGPNNSGKSSLFQALLALRQAASGRPLDRRTHLLDSKKRSDTSESQPYLYPREPAAFGRAAAIDLGDFKDVVRLGRREIQICIAGKSHVRDIGAFEAELLVTVEDNRLVSHSGRVRAPGGQEAKWSWGERTGPPPALTVEWSPKSNLDIALSVLPTFVFLEVARIENRGGHAPPTRQGAPEVWGVAEGLASCPRLQLTSVQPVYPIRGFEEWGFPLPDEAPGDLVFSSLPDRAVALSSTLAYDRNLEEKLSGWLEELAGIGIKFELVRGKRVTVRTTPEVRSPGGTLFSNEGTGTNQLPFILVPIGLANKGDTILLSEPEAHLHPKMQVELSRLFLKFRDDRDLQFMIETHSEHVLHAFLHAVAKGQLAKDDLAIYYFENENGTAKAQRLTVNERGGVEEGLPGFFDQSLDELTEYLEALKNKA